MHLLRSETTVAEVLKDEGYGTAHFGKWHLGMPVNGRNNPTPSDHGFDYWFGLVNGAHPSHKNPTNFLRNGKPVGPMKGYSCQLVVDEAIDWIDKHGTNAPFFINIWFNEPHAVIAAPDEIVSEYGSLNDQAAIYNGTIDNTDRAIGRLIAKLKELGELDNTIIHYSSDNSVIVDDNVDLIETNQHEYVLNFSGNLVNIIENEQLFNFSENDEELGDENIYLSGGQGIISKLDLFSGVTQNESGEEVNEFEYFKNFFVDEETNQPKRIINEAFIEFFVNSSFSNEDEPDRIYIYNYQNNTPLIDYYLDQSISSTTINAKINHLEPLKRDSTSNGEGISYKIRITEHLNNIILRDSSNAKLGLAVISDIAAIQNQLIQNESGPNKSIVTGSLLSPKGTILHGNLSNSVDKRPKIKIYYTEPDIE